jgi:hypothetical protein
VERWHTKAVKDCMSTLLIAQGVTEEGTHCHTAIHGASLRGANKEKRGSWDQYKDSDYDKVLDLELAQIFSFVLMEDNKEDVQSHGKCPEYICQREPVRLIVNGGTGYYCEV